MVSKLKGKKTKFPLVHIFVIKAFFFLALFGTMSGVEELYKQFGILADAKEKAGEVRRLSLNCNLASLHVDLK